ncbi:MAG: septum site-determining protein MinD, partial [Lachnospiraceae bacterium]
VSAIRDADRIIGLLEANEIKKVDLVVNRLRSDLVRRGEMMTVEDVIDILGLPLLGVVPDDENVVIATNQGEPLVGKNSLAGQAFYNICRRLDGKEVPFMDFGKSITIWTRVTGLFHRNQEERI